MDIISLNKEIYDVQQRLQQSGRALYKLGKEVAEAEREYRIALRKEIITLKSEGMPATLIGDLARGATADLKFKRDCADNQFKASRDAISALQSALSALQTINKHQTDI